MEGGGRTGACPWWGRGGLAPPPLENEKKETVRGNFNLFHHVLLMKLRGIDTLYMQNGRGWADRRLSMVGEGGGSHPPNENKKRKGEYCPISAVGDK